MNELTVTDGKAEILEKVLLQGDLSKLAPTERIQYYNRVCESLGLNPFTKPFEYISLQGKLTLYAKRDATEQLRKINGISIKIVSRERMDDVYVVTAQAVDKTGRCDESTGVVTISNLKGDNLANALMKAETKAKRRVTLSLSGLGWMDETEIETIPEAEEKHMCTDCGNEIVAAKKKTAEQIIAGSKNIYGVELCADCISSRYALQIEQQKQKSDEQAAS